MFTDVQPNHNEQSERDRGKMSAVTQLCKWADHSNMETFARTAYVLDVRGNGIAGPYCCTQVGTVNRAD